MNTLHQVALPGFAQHDWAQRGLNDLLCCAWAWLQSSPESLPSCLHLPCWTHIRMIVITYTFLKRVPTKCVIPWQYPFWLSPCPYNQPSCWAEHPFYISITNLSGSLSCCRILQDAWHNVCQSFMSAHLIGCSTWLLIYNYITSDSAILVYLHSGIGTCVLDVVIWFTSLAHTVLHLSWSQQWRAYCQYTSSLQLVLWCRCVQTTVHGEQAESHSQINPGKDCKARV